MNIQFLSKRSIVIAIAATATTTAIVVNYSKAFWSIKPSASQEIETPKQPDPTVTALGRLVPVGEVIHLSASGAIEGARIAQLKVQEGDRVEQGQVIAILDNRDRLQATLKQATEQVKVAQARLNQIKAGASVGEIEAKRAVISRLEVELEETRSAFDATIARLDAELRNARNDRQRYESLYLQGAIAASERDRWQLGTETASARRSEATANKSRTLGRLREELKEAKATLNRISEVRPVDVQVATAEVDRAKAAVSKAGADLELAFVRSPKTGRILKIHAREGEIIGERGIVELGQTDRMEAIAEVYQTDISTINLGQKATITSEVFAGELQGKVTQIGKQITRQNIFAAESGANVDRRIVEVRISLNSEDSQRVKDLTNLQVMVAITVTSSQ